MENMTLEQLKEKYADFIATLSDEDKAKVEACKTAEELTALAQNTEGELPDEIAEAVAGGKDARKYWYGDYECPKCHKQSVRKTQYYYQCLVCGHKW